MDMLLMDLGQAVRRLRRSPGFTLVAALTLALGIGGNAAVLTALEALLLRPLPFPDPDRLVLVQQTDPDNRPRAVAPANFADWRERARSFEGLAAFEVVGRTLLEGEAPLRLSAGIVSASFFDVLGVPAALGRTFGATSEGPREAVLGDPLWRERFGADGGVVGRELRLDGELVRVIGIMPRGFAHPAEAELWLRAKDDLPEIPIAVNVTNLRQLRDSRYLGVLGRLRSEATLRSARAEMDVIAAALAAEYPEANARNGAAVTPLFEELRGGARPALALLLAAASCVLLIACVNVANLLLARAVGRRQELAVRAALGAGARRLSRQLLTEAALLAALGGGAGLLLAWASRPVLLALWPANLPPLEGLRLSGPMLSGSCLLVVLCVALVGLLPAREAARTDILSGLRAGGRTPLAGRAAHRARGSLVVAEVALAVVLVSGAALLVNSLWRLQQAPLGFEPEGALTARISLPRTLSGDPPALRTVAAALEERLGSLPGVITAGMGQALPLSGPRTSAGLRIFAREAEPNAQLDTCWRIATVKWFEALRVPVLRGRGFAATDDASAPPVALVNATLARQVFGDEDPLGRRIATGLDGPPGTWVTIVGVVADTPQENVAKAARPEMYRPLTQDVRMGPSSLSVVLRTSNDPSAQALGLGREVAAVRSDLAVSDIVPLGTLARASISGPRAASMVLGIFGSLALFLAALGLYGVLSCLVNERRHEMGVRLALGARPGSIVSLVLGKSLALAAAGLPLGVAAALASGRLLEGLLFGVGPRDPVNLLVVAAVLLATAVAAAYAPARRASRLDPAVVLRAD